MPEADHSDVDKPNGLIRQLGPHIHALRRDEHGAYEQIEKLCLHHLLYPRYRGPLSKDDCKEIFDAAVSNALADLYSPHVPVDKAASHLKSEMERLRWERKQTYSAETALKYAPPVASPAEILAHRERYQRASQLVEALDPFIETALQLLGERHHDHIVHAFRLHEYELHDHEHVNYESVSSYYRALREATRQFKRVLEQLISMNIKLGHVKPDTLQDALSFVRGADFVKALTVVREFKLTENSR